MHVFTTFFRCALKSLNNGVQYSVNLIFLFVVNMVFIFGNMCYVFLGDNQFLEISAASEEILSFHDHGFVLFRHACGLN